MTGTSTSRTDRDSYGGNRARSDTILDSSRWATVTQQVPEHFADEVHPGDLYRAPVLSSSVNAVLAALRWGAVMLGLIFAASDAADGEMRVVGTVAVAIFVTSWRTISPIRLGHPSPIQLGYALADVAILAAALSLFGGLENPMVGTLFVAISVAGLGWGLAVGASAAGLAMVVVTVGLAVNIGLDRTVEMAEFGPDLARQLLPPALAISALAGVAILPGVALNGLLVVEANRKFAATQRNALAQTNDLLAALNQLARALPSSLDLADVIDTTREELASPQTFDARRIAVLSLEDDGKWSTLINVGFNLPPELHDTELPDFLLRASRAVETIHIRDLSRYTNRSGSGLYSRLVIDQNDTGLLAVEHTEPNRYTENDRKLLIGMADVVALTLANARSFNQLRSLAAAEERSRIARDLHDRLGQYLTYIAMTIERINDAQPNPELSDLHKEVQGAVSEFRDTLLELRTAVSASKPLGMILTEVIGRFRNRSKLEVTLEVPTIGERLPARIENEFLRICQEALTNVDKHANASKVHVTWRITDGIGVLTVQDDGRGFNPAKGIRGTAFGLVGMRERASSVGAMLTISSSPGDGTIITVQSTGASEEEVSATVARATTTLPVLRPTTTLPRPPLPRSSLTPYPTHRE